jgi:hypothetical protein
MFHSFANSTGLHVNYRKSHMYPINVPQEKLSLLANTFGCDVGSMSFTYLGLPMGTTKPRIEDFTPNDGHSGKKTLNMLHVVVLLGKA